MQENSSKAKIRMGVNMKFIHIADVHIGAKPDSEYPWGIKRETEIMNSFVKMIGLCEEEKIDLLLIAGDLFHRQPLLRELKELNYHFSKLSRTEVVLIAGNHDYIGPRSNYREFVWNHNVHLLGDDTLEKVELIGIHTEVYGFSYHIRNIYERRYESVKPDDNDRIHILLAHGGDEKNIPIDRKKIIELPFHYVALGHIHKPEILSENVAYSGSFEPLDKAEIGVRGYIRGEITNQKTCIEFVPYSYRRYEWLNIHVNPQMTEGEVIDEVKRRVTVEGEQNIYRVHLLGHRDTDICFHEEQIKQCGNIIEVIDSSIPDYDFEQIKQENKDNIIGLFIDKIHESSSEDNIKTKALYYGLEALISANGQQNGGDTK